jgi:hypothetical protein
MYDLSTSQAIRLEAARIIGFDKDVREILVLAHAIEHGELKSKDEFGESSKKRTPLAVL